MLRVQNSSSYSNNTKGVPKSPSVLHFKTANLMKWGGGGGGGSKFDRTPELKITTGQNSEVCEWFPSLK